MQFQRTNPDEPLGGRYKVIKGLGEGGFGQTFLAEDIHLPGRPICVIKQLKPQFSDPSTLQTARRLFDTEAKVLYKLGEHDQIPRLLAHFEDNQEFYLAQEFIEGESLATVLNPGKPWPEGRVIALLQDILQVLTFVHQQNVIHRDIKPANLICRRDGKMVLIDFGAVKQVTTQVVNAKTGHTNLTVSIGTQGYMPNEQLEGKPRFSSDVYAVGMIGVQGLTGVRPTHLKQDPRTSESAWRSYAPHTSSELATILDTMVRYHFRDRYPSAAEALQALQNLPMAHSKPSPNLTGPTAVAVERSPAPVAATQPPIPTRPSTADQRAMQREPNRTWLVLGGLAMIGGLAFWARPYSSRQPVSQPAAVNPPSDTRLSDIRPSDPDPQPTADASPSDASPSDANLLADLLNQADALRQAEQPEAALTLYDQAIARAPDDAAAHWGRCYSLNQLQRPEAAIAACDQALTLNPNNPKALSSKGYALNQQQRYPEALALFDQSIALQPDNPDGLSNRGAALLMLDRPTEAVEAFDQAIKLQPDLAEAWSNRGAALWRLRRFDEAIASIDRAIELQPNYPEALHLRQQIREKLGR